MVPRIFDNINELLSDSLCKSLAAARRADFCVGYFNLRGWKLLAPHIDHFESGIDRQCRLLVGMPINPEVELQSAMSALPPERIDNRLAVERRKALAEAFQRQLCYGVPTDADEAGLRRLCHQLKDSLLSVKLFTGYPLHAKLYLAFRDDADSPAIGYVGSSNLTMAGLLRQGELNVDVLDHDATAKLAAWFQERWEDQFSVDITQDLIAVIEASWAREQPVPPYHIYLKMAYTLSQEARTGIAEEVLPERFEKDLFPFQKDAVKIAARRLKDHGGVLIGDVVGLGKTITATAVASVFNHLRTLVICPKNLESMWNDYAHAYDVNMKVIPITQASQLAGERHYQLVIVDESHNLRNREGQRYALVKDYIAEHQSRVILLSATPYNKTYLDLASQLRLFVDPEKDIGIAPETLIREKGPLFLNQKECRPRTLRAFEYSEFADDWRELMGRYLIRRTRSFIKASAHTEPESGRRYLLFPDGRRSFFPARTPCTLQFPVDPADPADRYARLYSDEVVKPIAGLALPRYGLGGYENKATASERTPTEQEQMENLSRAGKRLMGFCRTGLFKRLESSGNVFILSLERHILRNCVFLHALQNNLPLPIGSQDVEMLDSRITDEDEDSPLESSTGVPPVSRAQAESSTGESSTGVPPVSRAQALCLASTPDTGGTPVLLSSNTGGTPVLLSSNTGGTPVLRYPLRSLEAFQKQAAIVYDHYRKHGGNRFKWIEARHFIGKLSKHLKHDAETLLGVLQKHGDWEVAKDAKLNLLKTLLTGKHAGEKVLVFTQFADTAVYLAEALHAAGIAGIASATGDTENPTTLAHRFSPHSNGKTVAPADELRVLIATDVLSEGQNLQDAHIVVNYDLPWAIIRLIQRAGRVDRIGQKHDRILCYSFLPADGVERIIRLRSRVRERLRENAEVVGSDETFFEDQADLQSLENLYHEKAGVLDGDEEDGEVDLVSEAYQIWKNAIDKDPKLAKIIPELPDVVYSARPWPNSSTGVPPVSRAQAESSTGVPPVNRAQAESSTGVPPVNRAQAESSTGVPPVNRAQDLCTASTPNTGGTPVLRSPPEMPEGVLVFMKTEQENCALAWLDREGRSVTESQYRIMKAARCEPETPAVEKASDHHELTAKGVALILRENRNVHGTSGTLGSRHGVRYRTYELLKHYLDHIEGELFDTVPLRKALQQVYENPMTEQAKAVLGQHLKLRSSAQTVAEAVQALYEEDELALGKHDTGRREPQLICSLGLRKMEGTGGP